MIKIVLPYHLQQLAETGRLVELDLEGAISLRGTLDALEAQYPVLRGTIRDIQSHKRRDYLRFFACGRDISLDDPEKCLPRKVIDGQDELRIVGAMAGG
jgi:molybdopterin synthase sulfur carrier subunit